jgi:predicted 3-demethylubiquinone-9 3-methyltransferase (glyoxalase superfamily)
MAMDGTKIFPHLWYAKEAEEAARFYASIFPNSRVNGVWSLPSRRRARGSYLRRQLQ